MQLYSEGLQNTVKHFLNKYIIFLRNIPFFWTAFFQPFSTYFIDTIPIYLSFYQQAYILYHKASDKQPQTHASELDFMYTCTHTIVD